MRRVVKGGGALRAYIETISVGVNRGVIICGVEVRPEPAAGRSRMSSPRWLSPHPRTINFVDMSTIEEKCRLLVQMPGLRRKRFHPNPLR